MSALPTPDPSSFFRPISQLAPRRISWLWPSRLAFGKLAILDGDPDLGKSLLTLDLCARLSTGRPLPDGSPGPGVVNAIVLNGEDGQHDTIRPRLQTLGADLDRVFVLDRDDTVAAAPVSLPADIGMLDQALMQTRAQLLVIDPIVAFLERTILSGSDQSIRRALFPLAQLAAHHHCAVLLVRHLNKRGTSHSLYRGGGSIGFVAACRSAWLVVRDPHVPARNVLAQVKNNLAAPQPSLAYSVQTRGDELPILSWLGPSPWTANQLLALAGQKPPAPTRRARARDFLAAFLEDAPRTSREIWNAACEQRLSKRTMTRAKRELEIRSIRVTVEGTPLSYWLLPGQELPPTVPADAAPPDLEPWFAPLRKQFPPRTPLDDL
jgi:hypothetical protein